MGLEPKFALCTHFIWFDMPCLDYMYRMSEYSPVYFELVPLLKYIQCGHVPTVPFQTASLLLHTS